MEERIVKTKEELKKAVADKVDSIIVEGELAKKVKNGLKIKKASRWALGLLSAALIAVPFTGGLSLAAAAPIAALTGLEVALIIAVASLGFAVILKLSEEYEEVESGFKFEKDGVGFSFKIKRKKGKITQ